MLKLMFCPGLVQGLVRLKLMVAIMSLLLCCAGLHVLINTLVAISFHPENACYPTGLTQGTISSLLP